MSRKKIIVSNILCDRLVDLMRTLGFKERQHGKFAKKIGVSPSFLSDVLNLNTGLSFNLIFGISDKYPEININWLLTGEGEMIPGDKKGPLYNKVEDEDPELVELLSRTMEILKSETDYSVSLAANIRSFHHAVKMEREVSELKSEVINIKRTVGALKAQLKKSEKIRKEDPPEKKEEFLKRRVI